MARKSKRGTCCICGAIGKLSYEHVPPEKAYNTATAIEYKWQDAVLTGKQGKGRQQQGGLGGYTLCIQCNSDTGSWYGNEYVKWARTCHSILQRWVASGLGESTFTILNVYPLRFLKQTVTMFFSLIGQYSGPVFSANHPQLMEFVLDKQNNQLPSGFRFWMNFYPYNYSGPTSLRRMPLAAKLTVIQDADGKIIGVQNAASFEEIAHPPFALYMTMDNGVFPNAQEITAFKQYDYDEMVNIPLSLRIMNSASRYPGA
ncbi:MAG: hypothetical protein H0X31_01270 [Nostocaceae cyanobacterium]|nr:hypothetical protein [Nostocaceae cyanobacterium]